MSYFIVAFLMLFSINRLCRNEFAIALFTDDSPFGGYESSVSIITTPACRKSAAHHTVCLIVCLTVIIVESLTKHNKQPPSTAAISY